MRNHEDHNGPHSELLTGQCPLRYPEEHLREQVQRFYLIFVGTSTLRRQSVRHPRFVLLQTHVL